MLPNKGRTATKKGRSLALKCIKSKNNKEMYASVASDDSFSPKKEEIELITKKFSKFFKSKKKTKDFDEEKDKD